MSARLPRVPDGILSERQLVGEEERLKARGLSVEQAMADLCRILAHCEGDSLNTRSADCGLVLDVDVKQAASVVRRKLPLGPKLLDAMYGVEPGATLNDDWLAEPADWGPIRPHHWVEDDDAGGGEESPTIQARAPDPAPAPVLPPAAPPPPPPPPAPSAPAALSISAAPGSSRSPVAADGYSVQDDAAPAPPPKTIADIAARHAGKPLAEAAREVAEIRDDDALDSRSVAAGCEAPPTLDDWVESREELAAIGEVRRAQFLGLDLARGPDRAATIVITRDEPLTREAICAALGDNAPPPPALPADSPLLPAIAAIDGQVKTIDLQITALIAKADALERARAILLEAA